MEKMHEKDFYNKIATVMANDAEVVAFCEKKIAALEDKAMKAKARAETKAKTPDELTEAIKAVLTDEPMTLAEIVEALGREDVTVNKVSPRASKLAEAGKAVKTEVKVDKRKLVAYMLPEVE